MNNILKMEFTQHGSKRYKERVGKKRNRKNHAQKALYFGITIKEAEGPLKQFMIAKAQRHRRMGNHLSIRVFAQKFFVFKQKLDRNILITLYDLPKEYCAEADRLCGIKRKKIENKEIPLKDARYYQQKQKERSIQRRELREQKQKLHLQMQAEADDYLDLVDEADEGFEDEPYDRDIRQLSYDGTTQMRENW